MWWDITKELINFAYKKQITNTEKKEKISKACDRISKLLTDTVQELKFDVYPIGKCAAMEILSEELISCFKGYMEQDRLDHLSDMLHYSSKLEKEYATRKSSEAIDTLIKTAGQFEALSIIYSI